MDDPYNAFCTHTDAYIRGASEGSLAGLTFAAKDLFDVEGYVTGGGNPDWLASHAPATKSAWVVEVLVEAGATMVGKTHTDELSRGGFGENRHYGTPTNPRAPGRSPGGSSSGSAAAVAGGLVDFALGTDTGGSVRIPSSFCGLFGLRPTHGRIPVDGLLGQAPSFDTIGWFARDAAMFERVGQVLLQNRIETGPPKRMVIAEDLFALADPEVVAVLRPIAERLGELIGNSDARTVCPTEMAEWFQHQSLLQRKEAWETFRVWINEVNPRLAFDVAQLFHAGAHMDDAMWQRARAAKPEIAALIEGIVADDTVICLPTMPCVAPLVGQPRAAVHPILLGMLGLSCVAGLAGTPQISLPLGEIDGLPVGLSLIGPRGRDEMLVGFAAVVADAFELAAGGIRED